MSRRSQQRGLLDRQPRKGRMREAAKTNALSTWGCCPPGKLAEKRRSRVTAGLVFENWLMELGPTHWRDPTADPVMVLDGLMRATLHGLGEVVIFLYPGQTALGTPGSFWGDSPIVGQTLARQNAGSGDQQGGKTEDGVWKGIQKQHGVWKQILGRILCILGRQS